MRKIYKIKGKDIYVEVVTPEVEETPPKPNMVHVVTRTLYPNSIYGQIEHSGWIEKEKLESVSEKKEKEILEKYAEIEKEAKKKSKLWYQIYKRNKK